MNKGYRPDRSFGDETQNTYFYSKESDTSGSECATIEEWIESGVCTIDGLNPVEWWNRQ